MQVVILAAGGSSRFCPLLENKHKSLVEIMGKPLIVWTVEALKRSGISEIIIVQSDDKTIEGALGDGSSLGVKISYVIQKEAKGMGNAIMSAEKLIQGPFFVLNPNHYNADFFLDLLLEKHYQTKANMVLLGIETNDPQNYGILDMQDDKVLDLIEKPKEGSEPSNIKAVGIYLLPQDFFSYYRRVKEHTYAYEDALSLYMKEQDVRVVMTDKETSTLKYPWDLFSLSKAIMDTYIDKQEIDPSVKIAKNVVIEGNVIIKEGTRVFENAVIKGPCYIGKNCIIGNNVLIRNHSVLEDETMIGANAEVARCVFQKNVHTHAGFFGDSIFDEGGRIGCGTITANVKLNRKEVMSVVKDKKVSTKLNSLGMIVGREAYLGVGVKTMPGVMIGSHSVVGPGSIVMKNIPSDSIFYNKFEEVVKKRNK